MNKFYSLQSTPAFNIVFYSYINFDKLLLYIVISGWQVKKIKPQESETGPSHMDDNLAVVQAGPQPFDTKSREILLIISSHYFIL